VKVSSISILPVEQTCAERFVEDSKQVLLLLQLPHQILLLLLPHHQLLLLLTATTDSRHTKYSPAGVIVSCSDDTLGPSSSNSKHFSLHNTRHKRSTQLIAQATILQVLLGATDCRIMPCCCCCCRRRRHCCCSCCSC
jgi:hypothetical protein